MEDKVSQLFERYERFFNRALLGQVDGQELASFYASDVIGAGPAGVRAGHNDDHFKAAMAQGYANYRDIGTRKMRLRDIRLTAIDALHCMAHVAWSATYARAQQSDVTIDFDVHYLVQMLEGEPKIFGWISGDEQALLQQHGVI